MNRLLLIATTLAFSVNFMLFNPDSTMGFIFSDVVLSSETWFYFLFEHLIIVLLAIVILNVEPQYRISAITFLWLEIIDTVDYSLSYGQLIPLWNIAKLAIFGAIALGEIVWHLLYKNKIT